MRAIERLSDEIWDKSGRVGVIDVGSNTVRLVAFDISGRIPQLIYNEKAFCGLGRSLATTGKLHPEACALALSTIHRFVTLAERMSIVHLAMVATAAVRDAENGEEFAQRVEQLCGVPLRIISGQAEAHYSALGVMSGLQDVHGLAGDLGGGSLELVAIRNGAVGETVSLPLGALRLFDAYDGDRRKAAKVADKAFDALDWLDEFKGAKLYAMGGAWRALGRIHMVRSAYPLHILHAYDFPGDEAHKLASEISESNPAQQDFTPVARKRWSTLPMAALVLQRLLKRLQPEKFVVSAFGLREGIIIDHAPDRMRNADPLIEFCKDAAEKRSRFPAHGDELMRWIDPLFAVESPAQNRLRYALCLLSDIGWNGHPDYRAEYAMNQVLISQLSGIDHPGRAFIGLGLFVINGGSLDDDGIAFVRALLSKEDLILVQKIGLALRLGQRISGGTRELLEPVSLGLTDKELLLTVHGPENYLLGEAIERRLDLLAGVFGRNPRIRLDCQPEAQPADKSAGNTLTTPS